MYVLFNTTGKMCSGQRCSQYNVNTMISIRAATVCAITAQSITGVCSNEQDCRLLLELSTLCVWLWNTKNTGYPKHTGGFQVHPASGGAVSGGVSDKKLQCGNMVFGFAKNVHIKLN